MAEHTTTTTPKDRSFARPVLRGRKPKFTPDDLAYAYECAADFLEQEEWPEDDGGAQVAAFREAAKRIRKKALSTGRRQSQNTPDEPRHGVGSI
jgi:hypothetical protein